MIQVPVQGKFSLEEVSRRGAERYEQLREQLEADCLNSYVAIDTETGEYAIGDRRGDAIRAMHARFPEGQSYVRKIGNEPDYGLAERIFGCGPGAVASSQEQVA